MRNFCAVTFVCVLLAQSTSYGQGFVLSGLGATNRSMAGAGTAAPLDAIGALHWNPASITALPQSRFDVSAEAVFNRNEVESRVGIGTPFEVGGVTSSDNGAAVLPAIGTVIHSPNSVFTFGLGLNAIGGFSVNFPGDPTNPVLAPPAVGGLGAAYSRFGVVQVAPTIAAQVTERLSIGIAPTINIAEAQARPFPFTAPNDANGDSVFSYPVGIGSQPTWGLGVQVGAFYEAENWSMGMSIKSPQWFQSFKINAEDELGLPTPVNVDLSYPLIVSWGVAARPMDRLLLALDVRYVDFASTKLFGNSTAFGADGSVTGLGWKSVFFVALGAQYEVTDRIRLRGGYSYSQNPISNQDAMFSVQAPAPYQHLTGLGASVDVTSNLEFTLTWVHAFENSVTGPIVTPGGPMPLSMVRVGQEVDSAVMAVNYTF